MISVVIPNYNCEDYIVATINSCIHQKLVKEVIVIDDGSTDKSLDVVKDNFFKYSKLRIIEKENEGLGLTRNLGIKEAKEKYILFLDSDDILKSALFEELEKCEKKFKECLVDMYGFRYESFGGLKIYQSTPTLFLSDNFITGRELLQFLDSKKFEASSPCWLYRREFLVSNDIWFPSYIHEDETFTPISIFHATEVKISNNIYYKRRIRPDSIMGNYENQDSGVGYLKAYKDIDYFLKTYELSQYEKVFFQARMNILITNSLKILLKQRKGILIIFNELKLVTTIRVFLVFIYILMRKVLKNYKN